MGFYALKFVSEEGVRCSFLPGSCTRCSARISGMQGAESASSVHELGLIARAQAPPAAKNTLFLLSSGHRERI